MAYIPWWQRRLAPTLAERFELGGLVGRASFRFGSTKSGKPYSTNKNVSEGYIYPIKNKKGDILWMQEPGNKFGKYDFTKKIPLKSEANNSRYKFDIEKNKWIYQGRDADSPIIVQKDGETFKEFHERRKTEFGQKNVQRLKSLYTEKSVPTTNKINTWTKNWLDNNLGNFSLKNKEKFLNTLKSDYKKFIKKEFGNVNKIGNVSLYSIDGLPNVSRSITDKMKLFSYDGFSIMDVGKFGGQTDVNPVRALPNQGFFEKVFWKNKIDTTPNLKKDLKEYFKFVTTNKTLKENKNFAKNFKSNPEVLYLLDPNKSNLKDSIKRSVMDSVNLGDDYSAYNFRMKAGESWKKSAKIIEETLGADEMKKILGYSKIENFMNAERKGLKKIFDYTQLPKDSQLSYAIDHAQGITAAAKSGNKNLMRLALTDLIGTTVKENTNLGFSKKKGEVSFESKRNKLLKLIKEGDTSKINELNKLTKQNYGVDNVYSIKNNRLFVKPISNVVDAKDRYTQYLSKIENDPIAKKEILKQADKNPLLKSLLSKSGKVLKATGKVIKPLGYAIGTYAVAQAKSMADEMGIELKATDYLMAMEMGDAQAAINMWKMRNDPEFAAAERAKTMAIPLDEGTYEAIDEQFKEPEATGVEKYIQITNQ